MQCIHCGENVRYRERSGKKCEKCQRSFAFEPKGHPLQLHDIRFKKMAEHLTDHGTLRFTPSQLHHALARKPMQQPSTLVLTVLLLGLLLLGLVAALSGKLILVLCALPGVLLLGGMTIHESLRGPQSIPLAQRDFLELLDDWRRTHGDIPGLLAPNELRWQGQQSVEPAAMRAVLICPDREILAWVRANGLDTQHRIGLLSYSERLAPDEQTLFQYVLLNPALPVLVLHDASIQGCLLPSLVAQMVGKNDRPIVDIGLLPRQAHKRQLITLWERPDQQALAELAATRKLTKEEHDWLAKGRWTPLLALKPAQLLKLITNGLARLEAREQQLAQRRAKAIGFLSWPEEQP